MYTQCPICKHQRQISIKELRSSRGMIKCALCSEEFDALELLSDKQVRQPKSAQLEENRFNVNSVYWKIGSFLGIICLLFQWAYFNYQAIINNAQFRSTSVYITQLLNVQLPHYHNPAEIEIIHSDLQNDHDDIYRLKTILINHAEFTQKLPDLKLTLIDITGQVVTETILTDRHFQTDELLVMPSNEAIKLTISLLILVQPLGGYEMELVHES